MYQKVISDYYPTCKRTKRSEVSNEIQFTKLTDGTKVIDELSSINFKQQTKLLVDSETKRIILNTNTIIDRTRSPVKDPNYDELIFKKPSSPAPKRKQLHFEHDQHHSSSPSKRPKLTFPISSSRKRPFVEDGEFISKLNEFQEKASISNRFQVSFYSPSKRTSSTKEQEERKLINVSPRQYLEDRLKNVKQSQVKKRLFDFPKSDPGEQQETDTSSTSTVLNRINEWKDKFIGLFKSSSSIKFFKHKEKQKEEERSKVVELIRSSPKKQQSNENTPPKSTTTTVIIEKDLNLPDRYLELAKVFNHLDRVVTIMFNRQEACTFKKVKQAIQRTTKREFTLSHLAQMLTIYPNAYKLNYDDQHQLAISPNVLTTKMTPYSILSRRNEFKDNLFQFAKRMHSDYLLSLDESVQLNDLELVRWHPNFIFPNIPESKLPEKAPLVSNLNNQTSSISDFWSSKLNLQNANNQTTISPTSSSSSSSEKIKNGVLRGLSQNFLDKVRNKNPKQVVDKEKRMIEVRRLPELMRTIQCLFMNENKKAIKLDKIIEMSTESLSKSLSPAKCLEQINLINQLLPDWLLILETSKGKFVKINCDVSLKSLYDRLD